MTGRTHADLGGWSEPPCRIPIVETKSQAQCSRVYIGFRGVTDAFIEGLGGTGPALLQFCSQCAGEWNGMEREHL